MRRKPVAYPPHEAKRKGHARGFADRPLIGFFKASHHVDDRGLARPVFGKDAKGIAKFDPKRGTVKDDLVLSSGPVRLGYPLKLDHANLCLSPIIV